MADEKYYYRLTNSKTGDEIYAEGDMPIRKDNLLKVLGLEDYTAETITKEEYDREMEVNDEI